MSKVFISYVREDSQAVDNLCQILKANNIEYYLDRNDLVPGQRWKVELKTAIKNGSFFLSVYSRQRASRVRSHVNEETVCAIEELRARPASSSWFIPIRIDDSDVDDDEIGAGQSLRDLNYCDLRDWPQGPEKLLKALGVEDPVIDVSRPLSVGYGSRINFRNGVLRYENLPGVPSHLQGMEISVVNGWCRRQEDDGIIAYLETRAPLPWLQSIQETMRISGYYVDCLDAEVSQDQNCQTRFQRVLEFEIPAGTSMPDFATGAQVTIPFPLMMKSKVTASGYLVENSFLGRFSTTVEFPENLGIPTQTQNGSFEINLDLASRSPTTP